MKGSLRINECQAIFEETYLVYRQVVRTVYSHITEFFVHTPAPQTHIVPGSAHLQASHRGLPQAVLRLCSQRLQLTIPAVSLQSQSRETSMP